MRRMKQGQAGNAAEGMDRKGASAPKGRFGALFSLTHALDGD